MNHSDLPSVATGFWIIDTVTLRLVPRQKLRPVVEIIRADDLPKGFEERIAQKFLYRDFQFSVDDKSRISFSAACFPVTNRSATTNRLSPKRNYAMTTGWIFCALLIPVGKRLSSTTAIPICRRMDRLIGRIQVNSPPICPIMP